MTLYIALYGYHEGYFIDTREFLSYSQSTTVWYTNDL
jgi:hypothetical protein